MKASSESGECASLISTGSFPVFEAACRPAMGLLNSSSVADPNGPRCTPAQPRSSDSPRLEFTPETASRYGEALSGDEREKTGASQGLAWRLAGRFLQGKA